jgi:hypothetical protein
MKMRCRKTTEQPFALCVLLLLILAASGCNGPEIKQDTPQAAVATLVKIYEANKPELLTQVVSPAFMREQARSAACQSEMSKNLTCTAAIMRNFQTGVHNPLPEGCPVNLKECFCKTKGLAAAEKARTFQASDEHEGLLALKLNAKDCAISGVDTPEQPETKAKALPFDEEVYCEDFNTNDGLATVSLKCNETTLNVVVQRKSDAWWVLGFTSETAYTLTAAKQKAGGDAYRKRLNADLK